MSSPSLSAKREVRTGAREGREEKGGKFLNISGARTGQDLRHHPEEAIDLFGKAGGSPCACQCHMQRPYSELEGLTGRIIRCAIEVHRVLGPGLLESVYEECPLAELNAAGLGVADQVRLPIVYKDLKLKSPLVVDLLVENQVVLEFKAVESLAPVHEAQLITYLKLTGCPAGLLINFNEVLLKNGIRRLDRPDLYQEKRRQRAASNVNEPK